VKARWGAGDFSLRVLGILVVLAFFHNALPLSWTGAFIEFVVGHIALAFTAYCAVDRLIFRPRIVWLLC
jgi:hypothetical protein